MKQSTRVGLCLLGPLLFGCIVIALASWLPIFLQYSVWIDQAVQEVVGEELRVLYDVSWHLAAHSGFYMQTPSNFVLLITSLVENYYDGKLQVKPGFNDNSTYINALMLEREGAVGFNYSLSMWFLSPNITDQNQLPSDTVIHLQQSAIFDSFVKPIVAPKSSGRTWQMWSGYNSDGLVYTTPSNSYNIWQNFNESTYCIYNKDRPPQYDPRCRLWFTDAKNSPSHYVPIVTEAYISVLTQRLIQSVCKGLWLKTQLNIVICIDYSVDALVQMFTNLTTGGDSYAFALMSTGAVFAHPGLNSNTSQQPSILELEFNNSTSQEAQAFNTSVLPLFRKDAHVVTRYVKNGKNMLLAIAPVMVMLSVNRLYYRKLSLGVVLPESTLSDKVETLKKDSAKICLVEVLVFACLVTTLLVGEWM